MKEEIQQLKEKAGEEFDKKITEYTIMTNHWQKDLAFELPVEIMQSLMEMVGILERVVTEHCDSNTKRLTSGE